jgi:hypothetical protein
MTTMEFSRAEYSALFRRNIVAIVAVVDTRSLAGARNHCEGSVTIDPKVNGHVLKSH